jgi:hypothetical protein
MLLLPATHFAKKELTHLLADSPVLISDWVKFVWLAAFAAAPAPALLVPMLRLLLLLYLLFLLQSIAATLFSATHFRT